MILAIDVYYWDNQAKTVSVNFDNWEREEVLEIQEAMLTDVDPYVPGAFYKRELPCILKVLEKIDREQIDLIIVDGYVVLDDEGKLGLGAYLYYELMERIPVIGVAKKKFHSNTRLVKEVLRGESQNPLFVSSIGIDLVEAADRIQNMQGDYRMPTLLKLVDTKSKEIDETDG